MKRRYYFRGGPENGKSVLQDKPPICDCCNEPMGGWEVQLEDGTTFMYILINSEFVPYTGQKVH